MKYKVRYELEDFVVSETFENYAKAMEYYNRVMALFGHMILDIDYWEVKEEQ